MADSPNPQQPRDISAWRIAEQYFRYADLEIETKPNNDGYVMTVKLGFKTRRVFFDPAGRITHVSHGANLNQLTGQTKS